MKYRPDVVRIPVERSKFVILEEREYDKYLLLSEKYEKTFEMTLGFLHIKKPEIGDILELPDKMIYESDGRSYYTNRELYLGEPSDAVAFPYMFNIENDYCYLTYKKENKRVMLQRFYG